ncbi:MAG TPA: (2Fe-2S)-binding protein [Thermoplasmata archaeon]|nr:(2Fe-2S)-binding protein [Thermoplasmata archaeon]
MSADGPTLTVNGRPVPLADLPGDERLLDTLRWRLELRGTKEGCRSGECGACTVLVDGVARLSCLSLSRDLEGRSVTTVEAVGEDPVGRSVQEAFANEGALQCGYCTPGFVMALTGALRERGRAATVDELTGELAGNLCRCTGYVAILRAVERARELSR